MFKTIKTHTKPNQTKNQKKSHPQVYNDFSLEIFTIHQQAANEIPDTANRHLFHVIFPH